jgi:hypothetical protein
VRSHHLFRLQACVLIGSTLNVFSAFDVVIGPEQGEIADEL